MLGRRMFAAAVPAALGSSVGRTPPANLHQELASRKTFPQNDLRLPNYPRKRLDPADAGHLYSPAILWGWSARMVARGAPCELLAQGHDHRPFSSFTTNVFA